MATPNKLELKDVTVQLEGKTILHKVNLLMEDEQIYTVVGPSGAGKTTLLRLLMGLETATSGKLLFNHAAFIPRDYVIGLVPQDYGLLPWQRVKQAIAHSVTISQKKHPGPSTPAATLIKHLSLDAHLDKYPSQLSGGQKQRVAIARALALPAQLLLMDEPFSALDALTREKSQQLFLESWQLYPRLTVFITHDIEEAVLLGKKIIVLGEQPGTVVHVIDNPLANDYLNMTQLREDPRFFEQVTKIRKEIYRLETTPN